MNFQEFRALQVHDNGFYIVFAYSSWKKDCEILLFRELLHESFQYYLSRRQGKGLSLSGYLLKVRAQTVPAVPAALDVFYVG